LAYRKVNLYKYVPTNAGWRYLKAAFHSNNRIKPHVVATPQGEVTIKKGQYYLGYGRKWEPVGDDPTEAHRLLLKKRGELQVVASGGTVIQNEQNTVSGTLRAAFDEWLEEIKDGGKHQDTCDAKALVAEEFIRSCKVKLLSAVTRKHCLTYVNAWLKAKGNDDRTRFHKFLHLRQCLVRNKLNEHLTKKDAPKYTTKDPVAFEDDELSLFWTVCQPHKRLLYTLLLCCGLRLQEITTLRWADILWNEGALRIQPRPEWGFIPKRHHCRDIPLQDELLEQLRVRKLLSKSPLVFCTKSGKPVRHLWDDCQVLFKKTKTVPLEKAHPHTFRATFCTTLLRQDVAIPDVMGLMGHKDVASTMRYMAIMRKSELREKMGKVKFAVA
jgi:integrase/recombinase XerD